MRCDWDAGNAHSCSQHFHQPLTIVSQLLHQILFQRRPFLLSLGWDWRKLELGCRASGWRRRGRRRLCPVGAGTRSRFARPCSCGYDKSAAAAARHGGCQRSEGSRYHAVGPDSGGGDLQGFTGGLDHTRPITRFRETVDCADSVQARHGITTPASLVVSLLSIQGPPLARTAAHQFVKRLDERWERKDAVHSDWQKWQEPREGAHGGAQVIHCREFKIHVERSKHTAETARAGAAPPLPYRCMGRPSEAAAHFQAGSKLLLPRRPARRC
jgi:hypothetical protein